MENWKSELETYFKEKFRSEAQCFILNMDELGIKCVVLALLPLAE